MAIIAKALDGPIPTSGEFSGCSNVTNVALGQANLFAETFLAKFTNDTRSFFFMGHGDVVPK